MLFVFAVLFIISSSCVIRKFLSVSINALLLCECISLVCAAFRSSAVVMELRPECCTAAKNSKEAHIDISY